MNIRLLAAVTLLASAAPLPAHRLDQYLQAVIVTLQPDAVHASMRMIPGVAISSTLLAQIDTDHDGVLSLPERQTYAHQVLSDLSLSVDGKPLSLRLVSFSFPSVEDIRQGIGEIHLDFIAPTAVGGSQHSLILRNRHQSTVSAYLMNCLAPGSPNLQITAQTRNQNQSYYQIDYTSTPQPYVQQPTGLLSFTGVLPSMFRLGMHHIAEGTDHLLFLIALLLPAPLVAARTRWSGPATARYSFVNILRVVTAFTVGHSFTLALAALGFLSVPSRPIEALIAFSILVSALHAWRPLFPGREAIVAAFFGLIHGLAFATTLQNLGITQWQRIGSLLGFNLGIEAMQLLVIAALLPALLILSRTREYTVLRLSGALFAASASLCWIAERAFDFHTGIDLIVNAMARHALASAVFLFIVSGTCWLVHTSFWQSILRARLS